MSFSDIHIHILYGTDDGPKTREDMFKMVDAAYENGTRLICATPHFYPSFFGDNRESAREAFSVLKEYCDEKYSDLTLYLGSEIYCTNEVASWLRNGVCRSIDNSRYVLVEFDVTAAEDFIAESIDRLLNAGYVPIIAHAERYRRLSLGRLWAIRQNGALVQVNAQTFNNCIALLSDKKRLKAMLDEGFVDFVSSDAHGITTRPPKMDNAYAYLVKKYDEKYANDLCCNNAKKLFENNSTEDK